MEAAASAASDREDQLRGEVRRAEDRMRAAEMAASEAVSQTGDSTKPFLRQIEAMAAAAVRFADFAALRRSAAGCTSCYFKKTRSWAAYVADTLIV